MATHDDASEKQQEPRTGTTEPRQKASFAVPVVKGLANTLAHILRREPNTIHYPEEKRTPYPGYRGEHRLKRDELGREKCTACFLCATACPAFCIEIVAEEAPWGDREKRPKIFNIDMMRCIYCGMCEEACPCDAIELTPVYNIPSRTRGEKIYDKEKLLSL
ncbi:MAG: NADH-quinone oxidoreductase subunit I [Planctomycetota bacterium]|nr:NADH-quinone oxidoreductase subunit I [Planctomycetota bacterium]